jgi:TPR repeat protein
MKSNDEDFNRALDIFLDDVQVGVQAMIDASNNGSLEAHVFLSEIYRRGRDVKGSILKSNLYLSRVRELAEKGCIDAQWQLSRLLWSHPTRSKKWFRLAMENGHPKARLEYAESLYFHKVAPDADRKEAVSIFRELCEEGNVMAFYFLGIHEMRENNHQKALDCMLCAAAGGFHEAYELADDLRKKIGLGPLGG